MPPTYPRHGVQRREDVIESTHQRFQGGRGRRRESHRGRGRVIFEAELARGRQGGVRSHLQFDRGKSGPPRATPGAAALGARAHHLRLPLPDSSLSHRPDTRSGRMNPLIPPSKKLDGYQEAAVGRPVSSEGLPWTTLCLQRRPRRARRTDPPASRPFTLRLSGTESLQHGMYVFKPAWAARAVDPGLAWRQDLERCQSL